MLKLLFIFGGLSVAAKAQCLGKDAKPAQKPEPECEENGWTDWFSVDDATDNRDTEYHAVIYESFQNKVCQNPTDVDVGLVNSDELHPYVWNIEISIQTVQCRAICHIFNGKSYPCHDYKVRYCCPAVIGKCESSISIHSHWTPWYDVDDPWTGNKIRDDMEMVFHIEDEIQQDMCENRTAIEARLVRNGMPYINGGNRFAHFSPDHGLLCISEDQECLDYKVRFCCAESEETETE